MTARDPDDLSFAAEMAKLGVVPMDSDGKRRPGRGQGRQKTPPPRPPAPSPAPSREAAAPAAEASATRELELERERWAIERQKWQGERQSWQAERQSWESERKQREEERARLTAKHGELCREISEAKRLAEKHTSLRAVFEARGCVDLDETVAVLRALLATRPAELIDAIELSSAAPVAAVLDNRVALVAEGLDLDLGPDCAVLRVAPERCEITGGSDIRAEFHRFVEACRNASVRRITIVGGSPAYRKELRAMAEPHYKDLRLNLVSGTVRREKRRAESDVRNSDLVIIWSATELDHSVSEVYTEGHAPILRVPHRGISRMLRHAAGSIAARQSRSRGATKSDQAAAKRTRKTRRPRNPDNK